MLVQLVPIPGLTHPMWTSAREALNDSLIGAVSIDRGATLVAFTRFCAVVGLVFAGAAVTVDRARAETMLFMLTAVTTFAALALIGVSLAGIRAASDAASGGEPPRRARAALGVVINPGAAARAIERYEPRRGTGGGAAAFLRTLLICGLAFAVCALAVLLFASGPVMF